MNWRNVKVRALLLPRAIARPQLLRSGSENALVLEKLKRRQMATAHFQVLRGDIVDKLGEWRRGVRSSGSLFEERPEIKVRTGH